MKNKFFEVLRAGINTTYQDAGRFGLQHLGVAPSGCMDLKSFKIANCLVGNDLNEGVIEFAYQGPLLKLNSGKAKIAITGNVHFEITASKNKKIHGECNKSYTLDPGDQIDIIATKKSVYGYLAVEGGFDLKPFHKSVSTLTRASIGPNEGKKINIKDKIYYKKDSTNQNNVIEIPSYPENNVIRVLKGPQYDFFSEDSQKKFFSTSYKVTNLTDRMGMRLEGTFLKNNVSTNIRSEGITKGAIQVPADGLPIILLTDHPTIGGYPKIANVISADYDLLVQKKPSTSISFKLVEISEAELAFKSYEKEVNKILNKIKKI